MRANDLLSIPRKAAIGIVGTAVCTDNGTRGHVERRRRASGICEPSKRLFALSLQA